ncbi:MAG: hypothetical protein IKT58_03655 [Oscillospiraceae bacterium]|nr:hypothetical protein [Oscillospiraceae bacterium]
MKKREYDDDDGRTIANMNVDGMPWYRPATSEKPKRNPMMDEELSKEAKRGLYWGTFKAVFLVGMVFFVGYFLLIFLLTRAMGG